MRIIVATIEADYSGRLTTRLPRARRIILVKNDGSILIHSESNSYKPVNWMMGPCEVEEVDDEWVVTKKTERLIISFIEIHSDTTVELGEEPGLTKEGVEDHVQAYLADNVELLGAGVELVRREYPTPIGPVDLLCWDTTRREYVVVEVKRRGGINGVEQLTRYLEFLREDATLRPLRGVYAALTVVPQARTLAEHRGFECLEINPKDLPQHQAQPKEEAHPTLFG